MPSGVAYRADIDGLRALAVLSVVAFHINESLVPGGFIGVDIFFVISGYLITSILHRDMSAVRFSFVEFYRRRILRIAPAYVAVTIVTLLAGRMLLLPEDMASLARSALWSAFSVPNIYFWLHLDTGYFASASNQVPLLHLWSLGVEEQFYLLWPVTLLLLGRWLGWKSLLAAVVAAMAAASFVLAESTAASAPSFAYYMLPARAGELLAGGLLAMLGSTVIARTTVESRPLLAEVVALLGYAFIVWGLYGLDGESLFPGINALYPCLGTVLLILAGGLHPARVMAPLRWRPVVWVGLISYSLYLWHWPVLAFTRYFITVISPSAAVVCLVGMFVLAWASHRWVELPFRHGRPATLVRRHTPAAYLGTTAVVIAMSLFWTPGIQQEGPADESETLSYEDELQAMKVRMQAALAYNYNCQRSKFDAKLLDKEVCVIRPPNSAGSMPVNALLIGDSNAAHYIGIVGSIGEQEGFAFRNLSLSSCPPLFAAGDNYGKPSDRPGCTRYRNAVRKEVKRYPYVLLGAQWTSHSRTTGFEQDLERTLSELVKNGSQVVILGQVPRFNSFNQNCELRRVASPENDCTEVQGTGVVPSINKLLLSIARRHAGVHYLDVSQTICPQGECSPYIDGKPIYFNAGHLSMAGSWDVGRTMLEDEVPLPEVFKAMADSKPNPKLKLKP
jgi:peptidoglycan/LPS O-acetylase OafA/YrhL